MKGWGAVRDASVLAAIQSGLKRLRAERGLTQAQVAEVLGVTREYVVKIEGARAHPSLDMVDRLCRRFELPRSYFLGSDAGAETGMNHAGLTLFLRGEGLTERDIETIRYMIDRLKQQRRSADGEDRGPGEPGQPDP